MMPLGYHTDCARRHWRSEFLLNKPCDAWGQNVSAEVVAAFSVRAFCVGCLAVYYLNQGSPLSQTRQSSYSHCARRWLVGLPYKVVQDLGTGGPAVAAGRP